MDSKENPGLSAKLREDHSAVKLGRNPENGFAERLDKAADLIDTQASTIAELTRERDEAIAEAARLERLTTRFPEHMALIVSLKTETFSERVARLHNALTALGDNTHQYQWVADVRSVFGDRFVRSVDGDNGHGMGRQAIAAVPCHLEGVAEFIAAANPDTMALLIAELLANTNRAQAAEAKLEAAEKELAEQRNKSGKTRRFLARTTLADIRSPK